MSKYVQAHRARSYGCLNTPATHRQQMETVVKMGFSGCRFCCCSCACSMRLAHILQLGRPGHTWQAHSTQSTKSEVVQYKAAAKSSKQHARHLLRRRSAARLNLDHKLDQLRQFTTMCRARFRLRQAATSLLGVVETGGKQAGCQLVSQVVSQSVSEPAS